MARWHWVVIGLMLCCQIVHAQDTKPVGRSFVIPEITVLGNKTEYKEDNPAVELVEKASKAERDRRKHQKRSYTYSQVDQLTLSLDRIDKWRGFLTKVAPFFDYYLATSKIDGLAVLPLSQREKVTLMGYNAEKKRLNQAVVYRTLVGVDQNLSDGTNTVQLEELLPEIDLYQPKVRMLQTEFPAPLGEHARHSYRYYLTDTIITKGKVAQVVEFVPRNPHAPSFSGILKIAVGDNPLVLETVLIFPKMTNVNFVENLQVIQHFGKESGEWRIEKEELVANMKFYLNLLSAYLEHNRSYKNYEYEYEYPDSTLIYANQQYQDRTSDTASRTLISELKENKVIASNEGVLHFMDEFRKRPWQRFTLEVADMLGLNYVRTGWDYNKVYGGSYFDIGPINEILDFNSVEGLRVSLGGRTTGYLSRINFLEGYVAYGERDKVWKYGITATHSFRPKRYFREEYPRHELSVTNRFDLYTPGQVIENNDRANLLYDVGVSYLASRSYRTTWSAQYLYDLSSEMSLKLYGNLFRDRSQGALEYVRVNTDGTVVKLSEIRDTMIGIELRWSPGEKIFEGSMQRHTYNDNIQKEVPVYRITHEWASKVFGGDYNRHRTEISMEQRLWMGIYGRLDYQLVLGKIWSAVPYPVLYTPPSNTSIWQRRNSFSLLNPLEYVADEWANAYLQYHMRGLLFDRIPWVKNLKLRGVLSLNMMCGNLTTKNRQYTGEEIFVLPTHSNEMTHAVYSEVGFGLENIFKALRIDVYRRITPLTPFSRGAWGIKVDYILNF